jgi:thymidylate kinase
LLSHFYPRPDLVICLDAPAEVLFARKSEGSVEILARRRQELLRLRSVVPDFTVVDATQPVEQVIAQTAEAIRAYLVKRAQPGGQCLAEKPTRTVR